MENDPRYWLALLRAPRVGPVAARQLVERMGSPASVFRASADDLEIRGGLRRDAAAALAAHCAAFAEWNAVEVEIETCRRAGGRLLTLSDPDYPELLRAVSDPPAVLYVRGTLRPPDRQAVAVVGSRYPTGYGRGQTRRLVSSLARSGLTIVSGLARGIDAEAHRAALEAGGRTLAVLGSGLDVIYPSENRVLADAIARAGAVMTEFPPGTRPERQHFPRRNRIISGLTLGTVVVEATRGSGSLITARCAAEQGREVFAVPGNVSSPASMGANSLLKQGARLVESATDVLEELAGVLRGLNPAPPRIPPEAPSPALTPEEAAIMGQLEERPRRVDEIVAATALGAPQTLRLLLRLELDGLVEQDAGMQFRRL